MQKRKDNVFLRKFKSLNSQEFTEEIIIESSSESSGYENVSNNNLSALKNKVKRKRKTKKVAKNISNLNVTITSASTDVKSCNNQHKSPILSKITSCETSPVLQSKHANFNRTFLKLEPPGSPIVTCSIDVQNTKSPILLGKYSTPRNSPKVRKKLFEINKTEQVSNRPTSPVISYKRSSKENSFTKSFQNGKSFTENNDLIIKQEVDDTQSLIIKTEPSFSKYDVKVEGNSQNSNENLHIAKASNLELAKKIKTYFDNNFGSDSASQQSISDIPTPKHSSKSSDEIDILTLLTQNISSKNSFGSIKKENLSASSLEQEQCQRKSKKKYKKGGLSYRLDGLLKKQNTNISLWQHEKFLAGNSNFLIPKGENDAYRIKNVCFKYGCYIIDAVDINSENYLILLNSCCVFNDNILPDAVIKVYLPYRILDCNNYKLVINVCKFECINIKT